MTVGIGLLAALGSSTATFAVAVLLRWAMIGLGARTGSVWDWFWGLLDILGTFL